MKIGNFKKQLKKCSNIIIYTIIKFIIIYYNPRRSKYPKKNKIFKLFFINTIYFDTHKRINSSSSWEI